MGFSAGFGSSMRSKATITARKEAAFKAIGTGLSGGVGWKQAEVIQPGGQVPQIRFTGVALERFHALGCTADVTSNANVIGKVTVFGDSNCDGAMDDNAAPIDFNGVGGGGGVMDKIGGHLKYNVDTKTFPTTTQCYILRVTVTDTSTGEEKFEEVLLQAK